MQAKQHYAWAECQTERGTVLMGSGARVRGAVLMGSGARVRGAVLMGSGARVRGAVRDL